MNNHQIHNHQLRTGSNVIEVDFGYKYNQMSLKELAIECLIREEEINDYCERLEKALKVKDKLIADQLRILNLLHTKFGIS